MRQVPWSVPLLAFVCACSSAQTGTAEPPVAASTAFPASAAPFVASATAQPAPSVAVGAPAVQRGSPCSVPGATASGPGGVSMFCATSPTGAAQWVFGSQSQPGGPGPGGPGGPGFSGTAPRNDAPPVLETFQLRVGTYDAATGRAGDLLFSRAGLQPQTGLNSVFLEFGHKVFGNQQVKDLPHFTFYAPVGTQVISPLAGVVVFVDDKQGEADKSVTIAPSQNNHWGINLDHITGLMVQRGATVSAGQVLGTVGVPRGTPQGWGANELTVKSGRDQDPGAMFVCPWRVWDPAKVADAKATITRLMSDWMRWSGDQTVYNTAAMVSPGCNVEQEPVH